MTRSLTIVCLLLFLQNLLLAQHTLIKGNAPSYSGKEIALFIYPDPATNMPVTLAKKTVATDGNFQFSIPLSEPTPLNLDLGKFNGIMVAQPGKTYAITLPAYQEMLPEEANSPFFKPKTYWLGLPQTPKTDLNFRERDFIRDYNLEINANLQDIYQKASLETARKIEHKLDSIYPDNGDDYFETTKQYYFAELNYLINQRKPHKVAETYFNNRPVKWQNKKYREMFQLLFTNFLHKTSLSVKEPHLAQLVNNGQYMPLVNYFTNKGYRKEFAELICIKGLNDGYHASSFSKEHIRNALRQATTQASDKALQKVAQTFLNRIEETMKGATAPTFNLTNANGEQRQLADFKEKFIYLIFFRSNSAQSVKDLDQLKLVQQRFKDVLVLVSIAIDDDFASAKALWKEKNCTWDLLDGSNRQELQKAYRVKTVPTYYLIDPQGKLTLTPAPSVAEGFQPSFVREFRNYDQERKRKDYKKGN